MRGFNPLAVWAQVPVANRLVEVNTKTGFSLTAGSYSVRASSTQTAEVGLNGATSTTSAISSVTTTRACLTFSGCASDTESVVNDQMHTRVLLTNATTVTIAKGTATSNSSTNFQVMEFF